MIIILTGLMGSGKTSVGKKISKLLKYNFIDLDLYIQHALKRTIESIFNEFGESGFRKIEKYYLHFVLANIKENSILSLGGGSICDDENLNMCKKCGILIWLNTDINIICQRLQKNPSQRPLLQNKTNIYNIIIQLLQKRLAYYSQSHYIININNQNMTKIAKNIITLLNTHNEINQY